MAGSRTLELRAGYSGPGRQQASAEDRAGLADVAVSTKRSEGSQAAEARSSEVRPAAVLVRREAVGEASAPTTEARKASSATATYWAPDDPGTDDEFALGETAGGRR